MLQDNYAVKDMQDLLAMTSLQLAAKSSATASKTTIEPDYSEMEAKLDAISNELDSFL